MIPSRHSFLKGAVPGAAGTARADRGLASRRRRRGVRCCGAAASYPFHGPHQAGIVTPAPAGQQACSGRPCQPTG
jgi:deferrochelatase/peroxidase EfeB